MTELRRILCIRLSAVGDVINTLPALESIRRGFPQARIGFVVEDGRLAEKKPAAV